MITVDREPPKQSVMELFDDKNACVKICAPMVRYSKLPFRMLVREYGCDLAFTPMIVADAFVKSKDARDSEFTTNCEDKPLIVQFASNNAKDFADASELVALHCDGVNLNCGCPQRWAMSKGLGAQLLSDPQTVYDVVKQTRNRISLPVDEFTISTKIRINSDIRRTVDFCRQIQSAGMSWLAVHARTIEQRCEPVDVDAFSILTQSLDIPVIANGDIWSMADAKKLCKETGVKGVMCARGLLQNPTMFADDAQPATPIDCIRRWLTVAMAMGTSLTSLQHHLVYMTGKLISNPDRLQLTSLSSVPAVLDFLNENYGISI